MRLEESGHPLTDRLKISKKAHLISSPPTVYLDAAYESAKGSGKIGTTGKGIGPTYTLTKSAGTASVLETYYIISKKNTTRPVSRHKEISESISILNTTCRLWKKPGSKELNASNASN